jgi:hypothetical protein
MLARRRGILLAFVPLVGAMCRRHKEGGEPMGDALKVPVDAVSKLASLLVSLVLTLVGAVLIVLGAVLSVTIIGAILGIPLILLGIWLIGKAF